jgi:hypothetical protein
VLLRDAIAPGTLTVAWRLTTALADWSLTATKPTADERWCYWRGHHSSSSRKLIIGTQRGWNTSSRPSRSDKLQDTEVWARAAVVHNTRTTRPSTPHARGEIGDRKPSQFLRHLKSRTGGTGRLPPEHIVQPVPAPHSGHTCRPVWGRSGLSLTTGRPELRSRAQTHDCVRLSSFRQCQLDPAHTGPLAPDIIPQSEPDRSSLALSGQAHSRQTPQKYITH